MDAHFPQPDSQRLTRLLDEAAVSADPHAFHCALNTLNRSRLQPSVPTTDWERGARRALLLELAEGRFLEEERLKIAHLAAQAPTDVAGFLEWFEALKQNGPGQFDSLFDFLAERATEEQVRWFIRQEVAGEAGFDDLVALTQLRMPERAKLELARNYWDEMGRGKPAGMHGPMLGHLAQTLDVANTPERDLVWEAMALGNLLVGLAYNRRYAFHSIGALGAVELTAPTRAVRVVHALERIHVERKARYYFRLHASVDILHWQGWKAEVLIPLLEASPELAVPIAEGALMRLNAGARTFDRYRAEFGLVARKAHIDMTRPV